LRALAAMPGLQRVNYHLSFSAYGAAAGGDVSPYTSMARKRTINTNALNLATEAVGLNSHVVHISKSFLTTGGLCSVVGPTRHAILSKKHIRSGAEQNDAKVLALSLGQQCLPYCSLADLSFEIIAF
jgi:hypothetical protein